MTEKKSKKVTKNIFKIKMFQINELFNNLYFLNEIGENLPMYVSVI